MLFSQCQIVSLYIFNRTCSRRKILPVKDASLFQDISQINVGIQEVWIKSYSLGQRKQNST